MPTSGFALPHLQSLEISGPLLQHDFRRAGARVAAAMRAEVRAALDDFRPGHGVADEATLAPSRAFSP